MDRLYAHVPMILCLPTCIHRLDGMSPVCILDRFSTAVLQPLEAKPSYVCMYDKCGPPISKRVWVLLEIPGKFGWVGRLFFLTAFDVCVFILRACMHVNYA